MFKNVLTVITLIAALQAVNANAEPVDCQSVTTLSANTMASAYSIKSQYVSVDIKLVLKNVGSDTVTTRVETNYHGQVCQMEWATPLSGCESKLNTLYCNSKQAMDEERRSRELVIQSMFGTKEDLQKLPVTPESTGNKPAGN